MGGTLEGAGEASRKQACGPKPGIVWVPHSGKLGGLSSGTSEGLQEGTAQPPQEQAEQVPLVPAVRREDPVVGRKSLNSRGTHFSCLGWLLFEDIHPSGFLRPPIDATNARPQRDPPGSWAVLVFRAKPSVSAQWRGMAARPGPWPPALRERHMRLSPPPTAGEADLGVRIYSRSHRGARGNNLYA